MPPRSPSPTRPALTLDFDRALGGLVAGVDEVGRAPLAGPVLAAAVILPADAEGDPELAGIDDSKKVPKMRRERLAAAIRDRARWGLGAASVSEIDRLNIHHASLLAMRRAVAALGCRPDAVLVDGQHAPAVPCPVRTVVGGDGLCLSIAAASIVAKVARDRLMAQLDRRHPGFRWANNAGYPTEDHTWGLLRLGPCRHHRMSFALPALIAATPGLGLRFGPAASPVRLPLSLLRLRDSLHAIADGAGFHVGAVRAGRGGWAVRSVGYDQAGGAVDGAGPLAALHGLALERPEVALLHRLLPSRGGQT